MPYTLAGGGAANMGGGFSFGSLFSNPLVLQMLASMGASLDPEGPAGAIGGVTNQWIRSQSQMKMMKKLLSGGAKVTMDKDKTSITGGSSLLDDLSMDSGLSLAQEGSQLPGGSGKTWEAPGRAKQVNPFVSSQSDIQLADLAGLRGEDINQAMQLMLGQRDISRKTAADIYDAMYKMGILDVQRQQAGTQRLAEWRRIKQIPDKVSVNVGGGKTISVDPKNALSYYAKVNDLPTSYDTYKIARGDPEFKGYLLEMAKAGKTEINIGDIARRAEVTADVKSKKFFTDPKGFTREVGKHLSSEEVQNRLFILGEADRERATVQEAENQGEKLITGAGGNIVDKRLEGRTFVWTVKWPDGTTTEVRYAN